MESDQFKEANCFLGTGDNPNTKGLPVALSKDSDNIPYVISRFKLTNEEMEVIKKRGEVWICIMGQNMPPVMPTVYHPFKDHGFTALETQ